MQKKIFFNLVIVLILGVLVCGVLSVGILEHNYRENIEKTLTSNAILIGELIGDNLVENKNIDVKQYLNKIKHIVNTRITVIDKNGVVLSDTETEASTMDNHSDRPEVIEAMKGKLGISNRHSDTLKIDFIYVAQPVYNNGNIVGIIRLSMPLDDVDHLINRLYLNICIAILIGLIIASLLGYTVSIRITKPINEISYITSRIAKGEFDKRINLQSKDEIGELAASINHMAVTLKDTIHNLSDQNVKLEAIMSSVVNGIIAIDNAEKVLFINPVAMKMLQINNEEVIGKHFLQIVRNNQIDNFLKHIIIEKNYMDTEVVLSYPYEKVLKFYTNPIKHVDSNEIMGIIVTIQDITELRKLEGIRSEFVTNVSHELKTPLTSIKGFVETLKAGAIEDQESALRFLDIIEDEADRLNRLISDILSLSELENKKVSGAMEALYVKKIVNQVISMLSSQADKKNIKLTANVDENLKILKGNPDNIKQMLINLVDNAIKYTPEKGTVHIAAYNYDEGICIQVKDNGIGIPKEHIPRLFERFYRVDKARSRKVGGTGLGLAIVKHIVKLFNGEIEVESEAGKGTSFIIKLPESKE